MVYANRGEIDTFRVEVEMHNKLGGLPARESFPAYGRDIRSPWLSGGRGGTAD